MICTLYIQQQGEETRLGQFPNRKKAEEHYRLWARSYLRLGRELPKPIYVETGKGRGHK